MFKEINDNGDLFYHFKYSKLLTKNFALETELWENYIPYLEALKVFEDKVGLKTKQKVEKLLNRGKEYTKKCKILIRFRF